MIYFITDMGRINVCDTKIRFMLYTLQHIWQCKFIRNYITIVHFSSCDILRQTIKQSKVDTMNGVHNLTDFHTLHTDNRVTLAFQQRQSIAMKKSKDNGYHIPPPYLQQGSWCLKLLYRIQKTDIRDCPDFLPLLQYIIVLIQPNFCYLD